jgi:hypothetical protein
MYYVMEACAENKKEMVYWIAPIRALCGWSILKPAYRVLSACYLFGSPRMYHRRTGTDDKRGRMDCQQEKSLFIKGNSNDRWKHGSPYSLPSSVAQPPERYSLSDCTPRSVLLKHPRQRGNGGQLSFPSIGGT